jgi:hypothetical protein
MVRPTVEILRQQLRDKFPQAHGLRPDPAAPVPQGEPFRAEAFPPGAISEVLPAGPSAGLGLWVAGLLGDPRERAPHPEWALVDGGDTFDPGSFTNNACSKLLWVRCRSALEMIQAADLLVHDGNMPFILLETRGVARQDLNALPTAAWWRLKKAVERTGGRLVVSTTFPLVPCASLRRSLSAGISLRDFDDARENLLDRLQASPEKLRCAT